MSIEEATELEEAIKTLVETSGDTVGMHTKDCKAFQKSHKTCANCQYELGCHKQIAIMLASFNQGKFSETMEVILAAKTAKELKAIQIPEPEEES